MTMYVSYQRMDSRFRAVDFTVTEFRIRHLLIADCNRFLNGLSIQKENVGRRSL